MLWFTVVTLHEDLNFPKPCKACDNTINDVEEMRKHLSTSIIHADNIEKKGYFSMTNPCGYCEKEFATLVHVKHNITIIILCMSGQTLDIVVITLREENTPWHLKW